jgi:hypothetical protein
MGNFIHPIYYIMCIAGVPFSVIIKKHEGYEE